MIILYLIIMDKSTITITYGEMVENHVRNQQIGEEIDEGVSFSKLKDIKKSLKKEGYDCEFHDLGKILTKKEREGVDKAGVLVVKNFVNTFFNKNMATKMYDDMLLLKWDKKALMKGRVVNKLARYNLCFADFKQIPDYENGKGRVYNFKDLPNLQKIRDFVEKITGVSVNAEGNYYFDKEKCYIGFHGDTERKIVVGVRFGADFPLYYQWYGPTEEEDKNGRTFIKSEPIHKVYQIDLSHGDLYIMSDKAVGHDWLKKSIFTLRHAAGNLNNVKK